LPRRGTLVGFLENPQRVGGSKLPAMRPLHNFRIGWGQSGAAGGGNGIHHAIVSSHRATSFPALYSNFRAFAVSLYIGRRGGSGEAGDRRVGYLGIIKIDVRELHTVCRSIIRIFSYEVKLVSLAYFIAGLELEKPASKLECPVYIALFLKQPCKPV